ncbi:hypothetical protein C8A05DRAFT_44026 [Staphylotrichum tortipilum]|uniref:Guanine nucleotide exchange factor LTE1 n=1 Tax=Staphylotrichum tortipilum TaxID=2831512 RepID=A0AAN6MMB4_9PEZI|nr:hypothetical protein C8A05DRAFT_44026 [Staphylotrichum longicolle]
MDPDLSASSVSPSSATTTAPTARLIRQPPPPHPTLRSPPRKLPLRAPSRTLSRTGTAPPTRPRAKTATATIAGRSGPTPAPGRTKLWVSPASPPKPLLPLTERKSHDDNLAGRRARKISQDDRDDRWDITPDGGSAGREGRQFAVANVGNNGRIYLRPTVRPANQRYPQPQFVFPMTPPSTAGLEAIATSDQQQQQQQQPQRLGLDAHALTQPPPPPREWTPSHPSPSSTSLGADNLAVKIRQRHRRALSDSTLPETSIARESEPGGFKVVITQPGDDQRPRTVDEMDLRQPPLLEIAIPSWKIGTPRFSIRGTPFIRGSSYAPTEEIRSSSPSWLRLTPQDGASRRPSFFRMSGMLSPSSADPSHRLSAASYRLPPRLRATYMSTHLVIEPAMFDALTLKPDCDDRAVVRYSPSGSVIAATPPRLVAEITSPTFVDYELLSDFFLTYRAFLEPLDLLRMLVARLRWAVSRIDEVGQVVRVRTFVALRHWILNYFLDDFFIDYNMRVTFCGLLNELIDDISEDANIPQKIPLKILGELKKCWRRVCSQFWDGPEFDASLGPNVPLAPGGIAGQRNSQLDPAAWVPMSSEPPQIDTVIIPATPRSHTSFYAGMAEAVHIDAVVAGDRPATPEDLAAIPEPDRNGAISPTSITSVDVVSCSFPTKSARPARPGAAAHSAAHPADPNAMHSLGPVASLPRALVGKRARPPPAHKRNGSLTDSLREHPTTTERGLYKNAEFLLTLPYAGSLVRGDFVLPSQALAEVHPPTSTARHTTIVQPNLAPVELPKESTVASAMSGQGMKRLLGSVRRALSTRGQSMSGAQGSYINISPIGPRGATTNRLPGTAVVPQARTARRAGSCALVRIDLLGAEVAEDFKRAVREDSEKSAQISPPTAAGDNSQQPVKKGDLPQIRTTTHFSFTHDYVVTRPTSDMGITTGSKSIVIVDDTFPPFSSDYPVMAGALLPGVNSSVEAFAEAFAPAGADLTPPNTPPARALGTPRRSSYILGQHMLRRSLSADPLPPFIPDLNSLALSPVHPSHSLDLSPVHPSLDLALSSPVHHSLDSLVHHPLPQTLKGGHTRQSSSRSYLSSQQPRRRASFASGSESLRRAPTTVRSFDATTVSGLSEADAGREYPSVVAPAPLRVLRRRPGGDLRAAVAGAGVDLEAELQAAATGRGGADSMRSSYLTSVEGEGEYVDLGAGGQGTFSLGAMAEGKKAGVALSLFSTHSSKPVMRPSFEAEAQKLALIPDDADDDGGVESALLKLEGRFPAKRPGLKLSMDLRGPPPQMVEGGGDGEGEENAQVVGKELLPSGAPSTITPAADDAPATTNGLLGVDALPGRHSGVQSFLSDDSRASYSSIPLLERGLTEDGRTTREWTDRSVLQGAEADEEEPADDVGMDSQHPSYDFVKKTDSIERVGKVVKEEDFPGSADHSFLDVDSDVESDISSDMSDEEFTHDQDDDGLFSPSDIGVAISALPAHPLAENPTSAAPAVAAPVRPASPPITLMQALHMSPETAFVPTVQDHQVWEKPLPPTPETTPTIAGAPFVPAHTPVSSLTDPTGTKEALRNAPRLRIPDPVASPLTPPPVDDKYAVHLPFILAFDSDILAQQFTLVEKDALNEIDWRELIDMRWKNSDSATSPSNNSGRGTPNGGGAHARSWVSFLRDADARGVEVVIARFNIMVKWAISEVVLTRDVEERARCVVKLIHIAAHCRRYRNFATMAQIAIALTSNEVARLAGTWARVPEGDRRVVRELEGLVSPRRNFWMLRREMESPPAVGGGGEERGCIPFVGIYTHDLLFNAQKPSEIAGSPTGAPLVNFERWRTAAGVVKTLMRLLEESLVYDFVPVEGVTERCLWMGALGDEEIRRLSEGLE